MTIGSSPSDVRVVREVRCAGSVPQFTNPEWTRDLPWLVQGITGSGEGEPAFDLRLFGSGPVGPVIARWTRLRDATGFSRAVHAHQIHGSTMLVHQDRAPAGLLIADDADAHATRVPGILLTVSVADCIPITVVDPLHRTVALLHAGWRGVVAGVLDAGLAALRRISGSEPSELVIHLGPAICGACYEVGPEVHDALGQVRPPRPRPIDLRAIASARFCSAGVPIERISRSAYCTRCEDSPFFSHRAGCAGRQVGFAGIR